MKPRVSRALPLLLMLVLVIAGCSSGDGGSGDTSPGAGQSTTNGDSGGSGDGGTGDQPGGSSTNGDVPPSAADGFTVGIPPGWKLDVLDEIGMSNASGAQLLYGQDAFDDVVSFFDQWITEQPTEYTRSAVDDKVIYQRNEMPPVLITVTRDHEERGDVWTYLIIAGGTDA